MATAERWVAALTVLEWSVIVLAGAGAGLVNALAGGGTLISFPALLALGVPPIAANVTNAIALCPGYFGATLAQLKNLTGQRRRLVLCVPVALAGGVIGAAILLHTRERLFLALVPYMIFVAAVLLALQERIRGLVVRRLSNGPSNHAGLWAALPVALAALYGGFFSAGMSVILLAVLGLSFDDSLTRLNALKQILAFGVNVAAAAFFAFSDQVLWPVAAVMAAGALLGGALGGRIAGRLRPAVLRWTVVIVGVGLAIYYWVSG